MKKTLSVFLTIAILFSVSVPAMAAGTNLDLQTETAQHYAYMDLALADAETQAKIIESRNSIIYSTSWVADGVDGYIKDEDGNIIETLPHFSEVFPSDWEVPEVISTSVSQSLGNSNPVTPYALSNSFNGIVTFYRPPTSGLPAPFHTLTTIGFEGTPYEYYIESINTVAYNTYGTYNLEYVNVDTNRSLGYKSGMASGNYFEITAPIDATVSIHGSTNNAVGEWSVMVMVDRYGIND